MTTPHRSHEDGLETHWREKLAVAQLTYLADPNEGTRAEYKHALRTYADVVLRGATPAERDEQ